MNTKHIFSATLIAILLLLGGCGLRSSDGTNAAQTPEQPCTDATNPECPNYVASATDATPISQPVDATQIYTAFDLGQSSSGGDVPDPPANRVNNGVDTIPTFPGFDLSQRITNPVAAFGIIFPILFPGETLSSSLNTQGLTRNSFGGLINGAPLHYEGIKAKGILTANLPEITFDYWRDGGETDYLSGGIWIKTDGDNNYDTDTFFNRRASFHSAQMGVFSYVGDYGHIVPAPSSGTAEFSGSAIAAMLSANSINGALNSIPGLNSAQLYSEGRTTYAIYEVGLTADFELGTIGGTMTNPQTSDVITFGQNSTFTLPASINLGDAQIDRSSAESGYSGVATSIPIGGEGDNKNLSGTWGGVFYNKPENMAVGNGINTIDGTTGTFYLEQLTNNINRHRLIGFFGTCRVGSTVGNPATHMGTCE